METTLTNSADDIWETQDHQTTQTRTIGYAYPSSDLALQFGKGDEGCWMHYLKDETGCASAYKGPFKGPRAALEASRVTYPQVGLDEQDKPYIQGWLDRNFA